MDELIDILDYDGNLIGEGYKSVAHKEGLWHKSVHCWVINDNNDILIQYRCKDKKFCPSTWDVSFAGHIGKGESSLSALIREGKEEIGIDVDVVGTSYLFTTREEIRDRDIISREFVDVFLLRQNVDINSSKLQQEEVADIKYVTLDELKEMIDNREILSHPEEYELLFEILKDKQYKKDFN